MKAKKVEESRTTMTELIMPSDANPLGNLMGGYLMRWMDIAAGICASRHCEAHAVTASVDNVSFSSPIQVGEVITLVASVVRAFNTSVEIFVEVAVEGVKGDNPRKSNHAYFTFVALDDNTRKPTKVPEVIPLTQQEEKLFEAAPRRREVRLILGGRLKPQDANLLSDYFQGFKD